MQRSDAILRCGEGRAAGDFSHAPLMPAKAGIQGAAPCRPWVPAFAGTSGLFAVALHAPARMDLL
ncbi:hypothetical protein CCR97_29400 [Rhodoplanes elegans]|nr:hypothetical protein [Rhodoplanes elegans]